MRNRLTKFIVLIALVIGTLSGISVSAASIATAEFFNAYGDKITVLTEETEISAKITFTPGKSCNANVVAALYEADVMSGFSVVASQSVTADEPATIPVEEFAIGDAEEVRLFVWNGFDSLSPLVAEPCTITRKVFKPFADVETENGKVTKAVTLTTEGVSAQVPAGVVMEEGVKTLGLIVTPLLGSSSGITAGENETLNAIDIHVEGVSKNNTTPIIVTVEDATAIGLNEGNLALYHVENGVTVQMTQVASVDELTAHNSFYYDAVTGSVTLALCSFSEIAMLSDDVNAWNGEFDYTWYDADAENLVIANADQLAALGAIVGGMIEGIEADSFDGQTITLVADINIGNDETREDNKIFYPIGYYNDEGTYEKSGKAIVSGFKPFEGTFDGNGHKISNIYQNTWSMKGDNEYYAATEQNYRDGMGLFGKLSGATVKNLTIDKFTSDGEFTTTGVIAAYADSAKDKPATFENIAITNCNPRVYNIGNGGIVGSGGWYSRSESLGGENADEYPNAMTFKNITVDNSNKISALWGSWDVACAGIMGRYYPDSKCGVVFENCHVGAQIDVFNDVCGNYQYYWYRYAGMMIGTVQESKTDENGYTVPDMTGITAKGCTVHFGEWNDYYYCELVANSLASYTHDHQFSRLDIISSLDEIKSGETWLKAGNFLLIDGDTKTCYHIVKDAEGNLVQHTHKDGGYETTDIDGDGVVDSGVLKEDKQIVYLPFNQLFQGSGWGVKHVPIYDNEDENVFEGVTILDREVADSVDKFEALVEDGSKVECGVTYTLGELFAEVADNKVPINSETVHVSFDKVDELDIVSCEFEKDINNWEQSTLEFTGYGELKLTIQDYYYCNPLAITVMVDLPGIEIPENATHVLTEDCTDTSDWELGSTTEMVYGAYGYDGFAAKSSDSSDYAAHFVFPPEAQLSKNAIVTLKFYSARPNHAYAAGFDLGTTFAYIGGRYSGVTYDEKYAFWTRPDPDDSNKRKYVNSGATETVGWHEFAAVVDYLGNITYYVDGIQITQHDETGKKITGDDKLKGVSVEVRGWVEGYEGAIADINVYSVPEPQGFESFKVGGVDAVINEEANTINVDVYDFLNNKVSYTLANVNAIVSFENGDDVSDGQVITYTNGDYIKKYTLNITTVPFTGIVIPENAELVLTEDCTDKSGWTFKENQTAEMVYGAYDYDGTVAKSIDNDDNVYFAFPEEAQRSKNVIVTFKFYSEVMNHNYAAGFDLGTVNAYFGGNFRNTIKTGYIFWTKSDEDVKLYGGDSTATMTVGWHELAAVIDSEGNIKYFIDGKEAKGTSKAKKMAEGGKLEGVSVEVNGWQYPSGGAIADIKVYELTEATE